MTDDKESADSKLDQQKWEEKKLDVLLSSASTVIQRARYVLVIINIVAVLVIAAQFNALFPWIRNTASRESTNPDLKLIYLNALHRDLEIVSAPLLGVKFSVFDISFIASLAMLVLATWFFYCVRRENIIIDEIYQEARKSENKEKIAFLYHGIAHHFVYTTSIESNAPADAPREAVARSTMKILFWIPCWLIILLIVTDIISLLTPTLASDNQEALFRLLSTKEWIEIIIRMGFSFVLAIIGGYYCFWCIKWDKSTRNLVNKLRESVL
jgi:hypothetical protein